MIRQISIAGLFLWSLQLPLSLAEGLDTQQIHLLDRLHQEGLISDALYSRRRQLLESSSTSSKKSSNNDKIINPDSARLIERGRYIALVIGSNDYRHFETLETAINDARAVSKILREKFRFEVLLLENPGRQKIIGTLATLRQSLSTQDSFLLFYAGHGNLDPVTGRGYWLPTDAEKNNPSNWVSTAEINDALLSLSSQQVLVIADSCYSGSLADSTIRPLSNLPNIRGNGIRGNRSAPKISRTVITSGGLEPVLDSIDGIHSVFSRALLEQLESFQYGTSLTKIYEQIALRVTSESDQSPGYHILRGAGHQRGEFRFPVADIDSVKPWIE